MTVCLTARVASALANPPAQEREHLIYFFPFMIIIPPGNNTPAQFLYKSEFKVAMPQLSPPSTDNAVPIHCSIVLRNVDKIHSVGSISPSITTEYRLQSLRRRNWKGVPSGEDAIKNGTQGYSEPNQNLNMCFSLYLHYDGQPVRSQHRWHSSCCCCIIFHSVKWRSVKIVLI